MAGSVSRNAALNLGVVSSDPMLGVEITQSLWKKKKPNHITRDVFWSHEILSCAAGAV